MWLGKAAAEARLVTMSENEPPTAGPRNVDPARCPLCGSGNDCAMVAGRPTCWCSEVQISADVLQRIPNAALRVACVCAQCAEGVAHFASGGAAQTDEPSRGA